MTKRSAHFDLRHKDKTRRFKKRERTVHSFHYEAMGNVRIHTGNCDGDHLRYRGVGLAFCLLDKGLAR